jgi:hypothetical protein
MFRSRLASLFAWATGTFVLSLACGIPAVSSAGSDSNAARWTARTLNPRMSDNGVELTVTIAEPSTRPSPGADRQSGRSVSFLVHALNRTGRPATGNFTIRLASYAIPNPLSRVPSIPTEMWRDSSSFVLDAGQSNTFTFISTPLPEKRMFTLKLEAGGESIPMLSLAPQKDGTVAEIQ